MAILIRNDHVGGGGGTTGIRRREIGLLLGCALSGIARTTSAG